MSKIVITFHVNEVSDHGYHRLQVSIMSRRVSDISDHMQEVFDRNYDEPNKPYLDSLKTLARQGYTKIFESTFAYDEVVIDWLYYGGDDNRYCRPNFKFDSQQPESLRVAHNRLSRIAKAIAKKDFDPKSFAMRLAKPEMVLATMRRLPSFHEVEFANPDRGLAAFVVDKINPAIDELHAAE